MNTRQEQLDALFETLSDRQKAILEFIETFIDKEGFPPTIREIGEACNINSTSVVNYNLNKLQDYGYLARTAEKSRGMRLVYQRNREAPPVEPVQPQVVLPDNIASVRVLGQIVASQPVPTFGEYHDPELDTIEISREMLHGFDQDEVYALRVNGDSMIDALIDDGDIVLLRHQQTCSNGDMVAVWLSDREETTLKAFYDEGHQIRLQPRNPNHDPIYVHPNQCKVQGKVLGVLRMV